MDTPKFIYAGNPDKDMKWRFIPDTDEARNKAITDGCNAFSTMSFDYELGKDKPEPTRYGSLWLDIDCKGSPDKAVVAARSLMKRLYARYGVDLYSLRYYLSGGKGKLLRAPNIQRHDGNYKVQLSFDEFMHGELAEILKLVESSRDNADISVADPQESGMHILYDAVKSILTLPLLRHNARNALDAMLVSNC